MNISFSPKLNFCFKIVSKAATFSFDLGAVYLRKTVPVLARLTEALYPDSFFIPFI